MESDTPQFDSTRLAPSPERGLSSLLRRRSRSKRSPAGSSATSLAGSTSERAQSGIRNSVDRGIDKLRRGSVDSQSTHDSTAGRLSKLVPTTSRRKSKRRAQLESLDAQDRSSDSPAAQSLLSVQDKLNINASVESLGKSAASSLLTEDSDPDSTTRPTLHSRQSHQGYLTLSSPLIAAETVGHPPVNSEDSSHPTAPPAAVESSLPQVQSTSSTADSVDSTAIRSAPLLEPSTSLSAHTDADLQKPTRSFQTDPPSYKSSGVVRKAIGSEVAASSTPPRTPTSVNGLTLTTPPTRAETPSTLVTPPTPIGVPDHLRPAANSRTSLSLGSLPEAGLARVPATGDLVGHRRVRSATTASSKLRDGSLLTPTPEEERTPGGSVIPTSGSGGFFGSFIAATQNAVSSLGATITGSTLPRSRSGTTQSEPEKTGAAGGEEVILTKEPGARKLVAPVEPAIKTLGVGNLSLSHLGFADRADSMSTTFTDAMEDATRVPSISAVSTQAEQESVAEAVSAAYGDKLANKTPVISDTTWANERPRSLRSALNGVTPGRSTPPRSMTPPRSVTLDSSNAGMIRSGSVRSRLSSRKGRAKRNSSGANSHSIAAALNASHNALISPAAPNGGTKPAGFAVANAKRNKDFHALFKSVPEDDYLIEDYSAALQRDILLQGRLYVSEKHVCFSSNILGWVTNLIISFDEIVVLEKKSTAMIFPNAIIIQTLQQRSVFASFISRDTTYDLLLGIWKLGHSNIKATENGHKLDESAGGDKGEATDSSSGESDDDESDEFDENGDDADAQSSIRDDANSITGSDVGEAVRAGSQANGSPPSATAAVKPADPPGSVANPEQAQDLPGPATHAPTECSDQDTHYDKQLVDTTIPAPLGKVYSMMFGAQSTTIMRKFLIDDQRSEDLQMSDDKRGLCEDQKTVSCTYIKPLGGSIGPKSTKCIVTQVLDSLDLERAVSITCSTQTPDVPSGNVFVTKTKYCLMWGPNNTTRFVASCAVEWSGRSFLKGPIEKGCNDGQVQYCKDLVAFFKSAVSTRSGSKSVRVKGKGKKKRGRSNTAGSPDAGDSRESLGKSKSGQSSWGLLEPLQSIFGPVGGLVLDVLMNPTAMLAIALLFVTLLWIRASWGSARAAGVGHILSPAQRIAAYEELWQREESQLWDWLDDRLSLHTAATDDVPRTGPSMHEPMVDQEAALLSSVGYDKMSERQVDDAVRVTAERLESLKAILEKRRRSSSAATPKDL